MATHLSVEILQLQNIPFENYGIICDVLAWSYTFRKFWYNFGVWQRNGHTTTSYTSLSIASLGKNRHIAQPTKYNYHAGNKRQLIANCYTDQEKSVIITYFNHNAQTRLNRFVVYMLYNQVCNKHGDKSNRWNLGLSLSVRGLKRRTCDKQQSVERDIVDSSLLSGQENCF